MHHGASVLSMTVFDFVESVVGPCREVVLSVVVAPLVRSGDRLPKSALYPYLLATSTERSRAHAIEAWHLPHWMEDAQIDLQRQDGHLAARVSIQGAPVAELTVAEHSWQQVRHLYQSSMRAGEASFVADILMEGSQSEHEDESGRLVLHGHPFHGALRLTDVSEVPFREVWMRDGVQTFENLTRLPAA